jgi:two-component system LytT family sensor kinase
LSPSTGDSSQPVRDTGLPISPRLLAAIFLVATLLGCTSIATIYIGMNAWGRSYPFYRAVLAGLPDWYLWAAATPLVFWLGQRIRFERGQWLRAATLHFVVGTALTLLELAIATGIGQWAGMASVSGAFLDAYARMVLQYFHYNLMIYAVIVAAAHAVQYHRYYRQREVEASRLQSELTQAHLLALQLQLQPHFLFNTLHAIASLVRDGRNSDAVDALARMGDLFRQSLGNSRQHEIPLREELTFVEAYLEIERVRFADRLVTSVEANADVLEGRIPSMALQLLVENAIRHGIARDPRARTVSLAAWREGSELRIEVRNDGPPFRETDLSGQGNGVGIQNVRARLFRLYGKRGSLEIRGGNSSGSVASLSVPFHCHDTLSASALT